VILPRKLRVIIVSQGRGEATPSSLTDAREVPSNHTPERALDDLAHAILHRIRHDDRLAKTLRSDEGEE
jgi:hypothetical protein